MMSEEQVQSLIAELDVAIERERKYLADLPNQSMSMSDRQYCRQCTVEEISEYEHDKELLLKVLGVSK